MAELEHEEQNHGPKQGSDALIAQAVFARIGFRGLLAIVRVEYHPKPYSNYFLGPYIILPLSVLIIQGFWSAEALIIAFSQHRAKPRSCGFRGWRQEASISARLWEL